MAANEFDETANALGGQGGYIDMDDVDNEFDADPYFGGGGGVSRGVARGVNNADPYPPPRHGHGGHGTNDRHGNTVHNPAYVGDTETGHLRAMMSPRSATGHTGGVLRGLVRTTKCH